MAPAKVFAYVPAMTTQPFHMLRRALWAGSFLLALSSLWSQDFLVQWDGAYLTRTTGGEKLNLTGETALADPDQNPQGVGFLYNEEVPLSPDTAGYDSTKPSAVFYGVLEVSNPSGAQQKDIVSMVRSLNTVGANYGKNSLNLASTPPADGGTAQVTGLIFWRLKDSPWKAARSGKLSWSAINGLSVDVNKINSKLSSVRFAVQSDGKWYVSEAKAFGTGWFTVQDTTWGEWPVTAAFPLPPLPDSFPVSSAQLKNITSLGLAFYAASVSTEHNAVFGFRAFYAEANPQASR